MDKPNIASSLDLLDVSCDLQPPVSPSCQEAEDEANFGFLLNNKPRTRHIKVQETGKEKVDRGCSTVIGTQT